MKQRREPVTSAPEQDKRALHATHRACYTAAQIIDLLQISKRGFFEMKRRGQLPFLEELQPRLGRVVRYRADLVNRYLAGQWGSSRAFRKTA